MESNYLSYIFLFLAGAGKGIMDILNFKYRRSVFSKLGHWWDMEKSWMYKWKGNNPMMGEKFPGSSTIFVFVTDGWHLTQWFMIKFVFLAVLLHNVFTWWDLLGVCSFYLGFWITFESKLLRK